jgi:hypothetical protein
MSYVNDYMIKKEAEAIKNHKSVKYSKEEKNFLNWMNKIEIQIKEIYNMDLLDFPDQDYRILFEDDTPIHEVIKLIINS